VISGAILLISAEKGVVQALWQRVSDPAGGSKWAKVSDQVIENKEKIEDYLTRCRVRDPDLWVIELDVPNAQRFTAELMAAD
jgi:hypothetical protein